MIHDLPGAVPFFKGHGTGNDFVLLPDLAGRLDLSAELVRALCDRRTGIGADGVLRVVPAALDPDGAPHAEQARFFMDYRNADGSLAAMCGNGARVFVRYLVTAGLAPVGRIVFATRGGVRTAHADPQGDITVDMGSATPPLRRAMPQVSVGDRNWPAVGVLVPNPHAVVFVTDLDEAGELRTAPTVAPTAVFPDGVNVEFVVRRAADHLAMRVFERGVGETQSCGTGACAAAWAAHRAGEPPSPGTPDLPADLPADWPWRRTRVDVPGGTVWVTEDAAGDLSLTGPAELVAQGEILPDWWNAASTPADGFAVGPDLP